MEIIEILLLIFSLSVIISVAFYLLRIAASEADFGFHFFKGLMIILIILFGVLLVKVIPEIMKGLNPSDSFLNRLLTVLIMITLLVAGRMGMGVLAGIGLLLLYFLLHGAPFVHEFRKGAEGAKKEVIESLSYPDAEKSEKSDGREEEEDVEFIEF